jgi:hypothetical protein
MGRGVNFVYNITSIIALILSVVVIIGVVVTVLSPQPIPSGALLPTAMVLPSATPVTPTLTFTPSRTPLPPTFTWTPTETLTPTPSDTATATITSTATITDTPAATLTPSLTFTPSISPTFTPSITPTGPTATLTPSAVPYPFILREAVKLQPNSFNTSGCNWQGMGGQIVQLTGQEFPNQLRVHVFNGDQTFDRFVTTGSNSLYGQLSGWEMKIEDFISTNFYFVQLELNNEAHTQISPRYQVDFPADCNRNLAIVNFIATR